MAHPRRWWILGVLCLSLLTLVVDNTVLNLAIPSLMRDLGATPADVQWIIDAYVLVFAGLLLTAGSLSDRYGRRRVLVIGLALFGGASLGAAIATEPWQVIAARALMGMGGACVMPSTLSILITVFDEGERRKAIAAWSSVAMTGAMAGPIVAGVLLQHYYWGSVFVLNVPIAIVAIIAAVALMPETYGTARGIDPVGAVLSTGGMSALAWAVISAPAEGWNLPVPAAAVLALGAFVLWERRAAHPMLPLGLFRARAFRGASLSIVLLSFGAGALMLSLTQYLQFVLGYEPLQAGLAFLPYMAAGIVFNGVGAGLGARVSNRALIVSGLLVMAVGFGVIATLTDGYGTLLAGLVIMGMGAGLAGPSSYSALMGAIPPERAGVGSALNDTVQQVGMALGVAVIGSVLAQVYTAAMPGSAPAVARESISGALSLRDPALAEAAREAFGSAMSVGSVAALGCSVLAAGVALFLLRPRATAERPVPERVG